MKQGGLDVSTVPTPEWGSHCASPGMGLAQTLQLSLQGHSAIGQSARGGCTRKGLFPGGAVGPKGDRSTPLLWDVSTLTFGLQADLPQAWADPDPNELG